MRLVLSLVLVALLSVIPSLAFEDLSVTKTNEGLATINTTQIATFQINVTNNGTTASDNLTSATLNDTFDTNFLTYDNSAVLFNSSQITLDASAAASGLLVWTFDLDVNESFLVEVNFTGAAGGNTTNNASAGNSSTQLGFDSADVEIIADTTNPTATIDAPANNTNTSDTTPEITFTIDDDRDTNIDYDVFVDGSVDQSGTGDGQLAVNLSALSDGTHTVIVQATDDAGNAANSTALTITTDATNPTATIDSPADNTNTSDTTPEITFTINDNLDSAIDYVLYLDGTLNVTGTGDGQISLNLSNLSDANFDLIVQATDDAGNSVNSSEVSVRVDTTSPSIAISSPSSNGFVGVNFSVNGTVSDSGSGVKNVSVFLNGSFVGEATVFEGAWNYTVTASEGDVYNITATAYDYVPNNASDSVTIITVDTTAPIISSISASAGTSSATITWSTNEAADSTVSYGTTTSLGSSESSSSDVTSHSIGLSSLSSNTQYYYNVTSCDEAGNCNTSGPNTFTTDKQSTSSGGGGGGGSRLSSPDATIDSAPFGIQLNRYGTYYFDIEGQRGTHALRISSFGNPTVFTIQSTLQSVSLAQGESKDVDLNADGSFDLTLTLEEVFANSVSVLLAKYEESEESSSESSVEEEVQEAVETVEETVEEVVPETDDTQTSNEESLVSEEVVQAEDSTSYVWVGLALLVLVVAGVWLYMSRK